MPIEVLIAAHEGELVAADQTLNTTFGATVDARGSVAFDNLKRRSLPTSLTEAWFHINLARVNNGDIALVTILDASFNPIFRMNKQGIYACTGDAVSSFALVNDFGTMPAGVYDCRVNADGSTIEYEIRVDGSIRFQDSFVGSTPEWGAMAWVDVGPINGGHYINEFVVSESPTVAARLSTMEATGPGFHNDFTGDYTDVDELGVDLTTSMVAAAVGEKQSWIIEPLAGKVYDSTAIQGLVITLIATIDHPSINGIRPFLRVAGVDYPGPDTVTATDIASGYTVHWLVNPATSVQFTAAELTAGLEIGLEAVA